MKIYVISSVAEMVAEDVYTLKKHLPISTTRWSLDNNKIKLIFGCSDFQFKTRVTFRMIKLLPKYYT